MSFIKKHKTFCVTCLLFIVLFSVGICYLFYNGIILFNNPSTEEYPVRGVDVSSYQGEIDWNVLSSENIDFAFIKSTEGTTHVDKCFNDNLKHALKTSIKIGAYHFFSFDSEGKTQAKNFISTVPKIKGMLPPVVDVEFYADKEENPPTSEYVNKELSEILNILERNYGVKPIIYTTKEAYELYIKNEFEDYDLWIRDVIFEPDIYNWKFWQYTNREVLDGYKGAEKYIDMNVFNGTTEEFNSYPTVGE